MSAARAGGITAASLIAGAAVGSAAQSWLRIDIVPIGVSHIAACVYGSCSACMYGCMYIRTCTSGVLIYIPVRPADPVTCQI